MFSDKLLADFLTLLIKINQSVANLLKEVNVLQLGRKFSVFNDTLMLSTEFAKTHNSALPNAVEFAPHLRTGVTESPMWYYSATEPRNSNATNSVSG
jgi:hypothetical protein